MRIFFPPAASCLRGQVTTRSHASLCPSCVRGVSTAGAPGVVWGPQHCLVHTQVFREPRKCPVCDANAHSHSQSSDATVFPRVVSFLILLTAFLSIHCCRRRRCCNGAAQVVVGDGGRWAAPGPDAEGRRRGRVRRGQNLSHTCASRRPGLVRDAANHHRRQFCPEARHGPQRHSGRSSWCGTTLRKSAVSTASRAPISEVRALCSSQCPRTAR